MDAQEIKEANQRLRERTRSNKKKKMSPCSLEARIPYDRREDMKKGEELHNRVERAMPKRFSNNVEKQERWIEYKARKCCTSWSMDWNNPDGYERQRDRKKNRIVLKDSCHPNKLSR